ncbi:MAG: SGNH/GDSL hydrolase family protein [Clostridia bacterium]|nr:SGNH/GDSL hydrolase family protein [Clostridia bacterium]
MRIVFYGDSITDAGRNRDKDFHHSSYGSGYVRDVASDLLNQNPLGFEIINRGISGNRIVDLYARIKTDLWNLNPDIISILIGVNDVWHEIGSKNGVELDRFERVYRMLIEDTKKVLPNAKIVILEPFVLKGIATEENYDRFLSVKEYAKVSEQIAKDYNLSFIPLQEKFNKEAEKFGASTCLADGVHPALYGARIIADEWMKKFNEEIK